MGRFANRPYVGMDSGSGAGITEVEGRHGTCPCWRERVALAMM